MKPCDTQMVQYKSRWQSKCRLTLGSRLHSFTALILLLHGTSRRQTPQRSPLRCSGGTCEAQSSNLEGALVQTTGELVLLWDTKPISGPPFVFLGLNQQHSHPSHTPSATQNSLKMLRAHLASTCPEPPPTRRRARGKPVVPPGPTADRQ